MKNEIVSLEVAIEVVLRNGPTFETIAGLCKMAVDADRLSQPQMQPCAGRNCGSTNPNLHSAECFEDYEKATGMATGSVGEVLNERGEVDWISFVPPAGTPLYTAPPPCQPLPDEPTKEMVDSAERIDWADSDVRGNIVNMWQAMAAVAPPRQPLTDEQISTIVREAARGSAIKRDGSTSQRIARAIEAAHGIKGEA